ncbi:MAG: DUF4845 domain-containing protein [Ottowia sp.]|nr:DUF4845 domain-containing protein [Ottowia sp.]
MTSNRLSMQRGYSPVTIFLIIIILAFGIFMGVKVFPTFTEYQSIQKAVNRAAQERGSMTAIKAAFERSVMTDYITSINSNDLEITKEGDRVIIDFAYEKEIPIFRNVYLLIKYSGSSKNTYQ